jgi:hypothetical protein
MMATWRRRPFDRSQFTRVPVPERRRLLLVNWPIPIEADSTAGAANGHGIRAVP